MLFVHRQRLKSKRSVLGKHHLTPLTTAALITATLTFCGKFRL